MDPVRASAHAHAYRPAEGRRPIRPNPFESQPSTPVTHTPGTHGMDSNFAKSAGSWSGSADDNNYGTARRTDAPAFKHTGHTGQPQAIPRPAGHGLSPTGYNRSAD
jgi:hypothetical protein